MTDSVKLFMNGVEMNQAANLDYIYGHMNPLIQGQLFPGTEWAIKQKVNHDYPPLATIKFTDTPNADDKMMVTWMQNANKVLASSLRVPL